MWTEQRVTRLRLLLADPRRLTTRQIAAELGGISRQAVIGKASRLGLPLPNRGLRAPWRSRRASPGVPREPADLAGRRRPPGARGMSTPGRVAFLDLELHHCRWPYGRGLPFTFCGRNRVDRSPYCAFHARKSREAKEQPCNLPVLGKGE